MKVKLLNEYSKKLVLPDSEQQYNSNMQHTDKIEDLITHLEDPGAKILHVSYEEQKTKTLSKEDFCNLWRSKDNSLEHCLRSAVENLLDLEEEFFIITTRGNIIKIG